MSVFGTLQALREKPIPAPRERRGSYRDIPIDVSGAANKEPIVVASAFGIAGKFDDSWDEITYRAVVDYDISDSGMVYLSYATGFIPGGFTETCSSLETCEPFDSETNWNLELGFKADASLEEIVRQHIEDELGGEIVA